MAATEQRSVFAALSDHMQKQRAKFEEVYQTGNRDAAMELEKALTQAIVLAKEGERVALARAEEGAQEPRQLPTNIPHPAELPPQRFIEALKVGDRVLAKVDRPDEQFLRPVEVLTLVPGSNQALVKFLPPGSPCTPAKPPPPSADPAAAPPAPAPADDDDARWLYKASLYPVPDGGRRYGTCRGGGPGLPPALLERGAALGQQCEVHWIHRGRDYGWLLGTVVEDTGENVKIQFHPAGSQWREESTVCVAKRSTYLRPLAQPPPGPARPPPREPPQAAAQAAAAVAAEAERRRKAAAAGAAGTAGAAPPAAGASSSKAGKPPQVDVKQREVVVRGLLKRLQDYAAENNLSGEMKQLMQAVTVVEAQLATNHGPAEYARVVAEEGTFQELVSFCFSNRVSVVQKLTEEVQRWCEQRGIPFDKARYPVAVAIYEASLFAVCGRDLAAYNRRMGDAREYEGIMQELVKCVTKSPAG